MNITIKTPAVIGLINSLQAVNLYDTLEFQNLKERKIQIQKKSGFKIPTNDLNPIYKVATVLQNLKPNKLGVKITIQKNIPTFSGLNSQISNAAGALIALNQLWELNLKEVDMLKIAQKIDHKLAEMLKMHFNHKDVKIENIVLARPKYIVINRDWIREKTNPFEKTAFRYFPDLKTMVNQLSEYGAYKSGMSSKGSTLYAFFKTAVDKKEIKRRLNQKSDFIWFGKTCNGRIKLID